jgi:DNA-binding NtrC family response regulator
MVVDDEIDILNSFGEVLNLHGINARTFPNPEGAIEEFKENHSNYKLVISDIRMSPLSGFEFTKKLRDIDPAVKVIFMTAFEIERDNLRELDTYEFFNKPIKMDNLIQLVKKYVK